MILRLPSMGGNFCLIGWPGCASTSYTAGLQSTSEPADIAFAAPAALAVFFSKSKGLVKSKYRFSFNLWLFILIFDSVTCYKVTYNSYIKIKIPLSF
jgi:hypothetical protein